ncbi:histone demethylase JARID1D [Tothia fuscella]|uniref:Histone demethylase JARID1D n=1 Tax=Tothia fuscella TaxID=1048955 RepID=A0A9P4P502_9PEZI|nr:histone demethylase JARID1D [Tothia fuscella]
MVSTPAVGPMAAMTSTINMRNSVNGTNPNSAKASRMSSASLPPSTNGPPPPPLPVVEKIKVAPPLSSRIAEPLDLSLVERRGQPNASKEPDHKAARVNGLEEAPVFRPTEEEFADPMEYIRKIASEGSTYGICKIIPPDSWNPDFAIDTERFHFKTRRQELNMTDGTSRSNLTYLDQLAKFHKQRTGANLNRFPSVDKRPLDLYKLKKFVEDKGGFDSVCRQKRWAEIGRELGYSGKIMSSLSTSLKNSYQKWLYPYEEWLKENKPRVLQQQEMENGGPYTPSPAPTPVKAQQTPASIAANSPAIRASAALHASIQAASLGPNPFGNSLGHQVGHGPVSAPIPSVESAPPRPLISSGFTAVNVAPSGFTAVNAPTPTPSSTFAAVNVPNGFHATNTGRSSPQRSEASPMISAKNTPDLRPFGGADFSLTPSLNGQGSNSLKRQLSSDADSGENGEVDASGRMSKRHRKDAAPTVSGSHMVQPRLPAARLHPARDRSAEQPGDVCEVCGKDDNPTTILLCDTCDRGYHLGCLDPPLQRVSDRDWHCSKCLVGTGDFGFEEGNIYSLKEFYERAKRIKDDYFSSRTPFDPILGKNRLPTEDDVEREFWRLAESLTEKMENIEYGADIHTTTHGSGFPTMEIDPLNPYSTSRWNLNVLPLHQESLFRHIKTDISGMTVPWLYAGMCFSTFCWHAEDHYTYSANYQHLGATKTWYGIPGEDAERFEAAMRDSVPELFERVPDLLYQLVTLLQPEKLLAAGVRVYALDQRAGQFVITFPRAFHAGFNHGFNLNEAVNFAPSDWEPFGQEAIQRLRDFRRPPVFCHEELLFSAAAQKELSIKTAKWLGPALQKMMEVEFKAREEFTTEYNKALNPVTEEADGDSVLGTHSDFPFEKDATAPTDSEIACMYCQAFCYLSRVVCKKTSRMICLQHAGKFECCGSSVEDRYSLKDGEHIVQIYKTDEELSTAVQKVVDLAETPEVWTSRFDKILEDKKPSLKALRSLLAEGEKINSHWSLEGLEDLRKYVDACTEWVEEATNYITRKQQNRRKSGSSWKKNSKKTDEVEERERELRNPDNIKRLIDKADSIWFDCPELQSLRERSEKITSFRKRAHAALNRPGIAGSDLEELIEDGKSYNVDLPEVEKLETHIRTVKWFEEAKENADKIAQGTPLSLQEVTAFIQKGKDLGIHESEEYMTYFVDQKDQGEFWEGRAKELMSVENVNFQQLDALSKQASKLPISKDTLAQIDAMLLKQREAQDRIQSLYERSKEEDFRKRPKYQEVREAMEELSELASKPQGTLDLEKEQKRHEDWMRRGKKLFGKANAPLHILHQHMKYVEERNDACLDLRDQPRMPVEPASREHTPEPSHTAHDGSGSSRDVFCICRKPESGMMIECELCHEWYHGKCLKIARGKVKEDDKYTCPICDYRLKIPRDAARPKLEELQQWQDEVPTLPFQPEEEETLDNIVTKATDFRSSIASLLNPLMSTPDELPVQRFYLRKIEGADVLLADETNFLRRELHKWAPVAPDPPKMIDMSLSTRKPRPTKQQKLMAQLGITNPDDLPEHLRPKAPGIKKKDKGDDPKKQPGSKASSSRGGNAHDSNTPPGLPHGVSNDNSRFDLATALPTDNDRHHTFSFDAMAGGVSFATQDSPISASPHVQTSNSILSGIDPQLENMFGPPPTTSGHHNSVGGGGGGVHLHSHHRSGIDHTPLNTSFLGRDDGDGGDGMALHRDEDPLGVFDGFFAEEDDAEVGNYGIDG